MAQKLTLVDDIDGTPIDDGGGTVRFSLEGANYEIDLSSKNAKELREALSAYISAARRTRGTTATTSSPRKSDPKRLSAIREWAAENGHEVSSRGRISTQILEAYDAAH